MTVLRSAVGRVLKNFGVGPNQIKVCVSDGSIDRMGDIVEPRGVKLANFRRNPIVLAQHSVNDPIARCIDIGLDDGPQGERLVALVEFPAAGTSEASDKYLRLLKAGVISAASIGFIPLAQEPLGLGGLRFTSTELIEFSFVSVPANASALVTERRLRGKSDQALVREFYAALARPRDRAADLVKALALRARVSARGLQAPEPDAFALQADRLESRRADQAAGALQVLFAGLHW